MHRRVATAAYRAVDPRCPAFALDVAVAVDLLLILPGTGYLGTRYWLLILGAQHQALAPICSAKRLAVDVPAP